MSTYQNLIVERDGPWRIVTINRPERRNALSRALLEELAQVMPVLCAEPEVRVIVITGAGDKAFCAGADLKERQGMSEDDVRGLLGLYRRAFGAVDRSSVPVIAAINGVALGGGFELALACDLRIAVAEATVGLPETSLAIIPGAGGTQRLSRLVGPGRAKEMILLAQKFTGTAALTAGLVTAVAHAGESALNAARRVAAPLAQGAPIAFAAAMAAIDDGWDLTLDAAFDLEHRCYERTLVSSDRREALAAFNEKRAPVFSGK